MFVGARVSAWGWNGLLSGWGAGFIAPALVPALRRVWRQLLPCARGSCQPQGCRLVVGVGGLQATPCIWPLLVSHAPSVRRGDSEQRIQEQWQQGAGPPSPVVPPLPPIAATTTAGADRAVAQAFCASHVDLQLVAAPSRCTQPDTAAGKYLGRALLGKPATSANGMCLQHWACGAKQALPPSPSSQEEFRLPRNPAPPTAAWRQQPMPQARLMQPAAGGHHAWGHRGSGKRGARLWGGAPSTCYALHLLPWGPPPPPPSRTVTPLDVAPLDHPPGHTPPSSPLTIMTTTLGSRPSHCLPPPPPPSRAHARTHNTHTDAHTTWRHLFAMSLCCVPQPWVPQKGPTPTPAHSEAS